MSIVGKTRIQLPSKDSIFALPKGGPVRSLLWMRGGDYVIAKKIDEKVLPDSVRARHILVATTNPQNGQQVLDDSSAKRKIDSIKNLIEPRRFFLTVLPSSSPTTRAAKKNKAGDLGLFHRRTGWSRNLANSPLTGRRGIKK